MWLDDVFVPWERVFAVDPEPEAIPRWLRWHHLRGWLAKAEFSLGLGLALTDAMGLKQNNATVEYLVDLIAEVQIVRSCLTAAEHDPEFTPTGYCLPNHAHLAAGGTSLLKARQLVSEILRVIPGSSLVVAPTDDDLTMPELAAGLEETLGGGAMVGASARGATAIGMGPCVVRARRTRVSFRTACQRLYVRLARLAPPQLQGLQQPRQCGAEGNRHRHAGDRRRQHWYRAIRAAAGWPIAAGRREMRGRVIGLDYAPPHPGASGIMCPGQ